MKRNEFLQTLVGGTLALSAVSFKSNAHIAEPQQQLLPPFSQAPLPYATEALEPVIDKMTMEIHYGKHHAAYVANLNSAIQGTDMEKLTLEELLRNISKYPVAVRNNGGGHWNHDFFWASMSPKKSSPSAALSAALNQAFGSMEGFQQTFAKAATGRFGSGWAWLIMADGKLVVSSTPNQDNPLMDVAEQKGIPLLGLDVWEHAYYLKYQNKRADYITNFWQVVNWEIVNQRFTAAAKK